MTDSNDEIERLRQRVAELEASESEAITRAGAIIGARLDVGKQLETANYAVRDACKLFERMARDDHRHPPDDHVAPETWQSVCEWQARPEVTGAMDTRGHVGSRLEPAALTRWAPCVVDAEDEDGPVFQGFLTDPAGEWVRWADLAAQPATAPAYDARFESCPCETADEHERGACLPTRTEAEQRVLDALREADIYTKADGRHGFTSEWVEHRACEAELARRVLK